MGWIVPRNVRKGSGSEVRSLAGTSNVPVQSGSLAHAWNVPEVDGFVVVSPSILTQERANELIRFIE